MYKQNRMATSQLTSVEVLEGETIESKIERIVSNKEPIKDGAPEIFTERKDGVIAAYNIRTDRWEIAADAMDKVAKSIEARREERAKAAEDAQNKAVSGSKGDDKGDGVGDPGVSGAKSTQGKKGGE